MQKKNYEIDWEGERVVKRESDWRMRKTKEAIQLRLQGVVTSMNRDQGAFLSGIHDPLFVRSAETPEAQSCE